MNSVISGSEEFRAIYRHLGRCALHFILLCAPVHLYALRHTIMLSPAGDASTPGRTLADGFERGATRQLAEAIKNNLEHDELVRVIMSHNVGDYITQEQKASFANSLGVDLYIALGVYPAAHIRIDPYVYQAINVSTNTNNRLTFCPFKHARQATNTPFIIPEQFHKQFTITPITGAPLIALEGIQALAYYIEIGVINMHDVTACVDALCASIQGLIHEH